MCVSSACCAACAAQLAHKQSQMAMRNLGHENRQLHSQLMGMLQSQTTSAWLRGEDTK